MSRISFQWDSAVGPCLHAPGLPDLTVGAEAVFAWVNASGLWVSMDNNVDLYPFEDIRGIALSKMKCVVLTGNASSDDVICSIDIHTGQVWALSPIAGRNVDIGTDVGVVDCGAERVAIALPEGDVLSLPVGARDARPKPWSTGWGVVWVDQVQVYRLAFGGRPSAVGRLPSRPSSWVVGPNGCAIFECSGVVFGMAAGGGVIRLPPLDIATSRFDDTGGEVLVVSDDGTVRIRLLDGQVVQRAHGRMVPVGYNGEPTVMDEDSGTVKALSGRIIRAGFSPCAVSTFGQVMYGPGGTAWDLQARRQLWSHAPLGGIFLVAHVGGVFQIDDRIVGFDEEGREVSDVPFPVDEEMDGCVLAVEYDGDGFQVQTDEGVVYLSVQGERLGFEVMETDAVEPTLTSSSEPNVPIKGTDGSCLVAGRVWYWSEEGMLASYPAQGDSID